MAPIPGSPVARCETAILFASLFTSRMAMHVHVCVHVHRARRSCTSQTVRAVTDARAQMGWTGPWMYGGIRDSPFTLFCLVRSWPVRSPQHPQHLRSKIQV